MSSHVIANCEKCGRAFAEQPENRRPIALKCVDDREGFQDSRLWMVVHEGFGYTDADAVWCVACIEEYGEKADVKLPGGFG